MSVVYRLDEREGQGGGRGEGGEGLDRFMRASRIYTEA
jgi:hypothetical protein